MRRLHIMFVKAKINVAPLRRLLLVMFFYLLSIFFVVYAAFGIFLFMETTYRFLLPTFALVLFLFLYTTTKFYLINLCSKRETVALTFETATLYPRISREKKEMCRTAAHVFGLEPRLGAAAQAHQSSPRLRKSMAWSSFLAQAYFPELHPN